MYIYIYVCVCVYIYVYIYIYIYIFFFFLFNILKFLFNSAFLTESLVFVCITLTFQNNSSYRSFSKTIHHKDLFNDITFYYIT